MNFTKAGEKEVEHDEMQNNAKYFSSDSMMKDESQKKNKAKEIAYRTEHIEIHSKYLQNTRNIRR